MSVKTLTKDNFTTEVLQSDQAVLLDFWAPWCGPCRMVSPIVDQVAAEVDGRAKVGKVNVDEQPELAAQFGVMSIPTLVVMKQGKAVATRVGVQSKQAILNMLG
ncbi:thioredoxin [Anaerotruncus massiliensis (ex Togo et al. 2019)]|uniref:thioredoxin n=1 Tax=Anaerotruncus massiliensis (ex Togo et al. 2019) TaxID=1673720 RepID=UPI000C766A17|nr:thioredoxin [Anaerotruncus massiliensis (ex Togo et al. 2019)]GKH46556.1 thioredoxin [Oscillospiraceae bacterium]